MKNPTPASTVQVCHNLSPSGATLEAQFTARIRQVSLPVSKQQRAYFFLQPTMIRHLFCIAAAQALLAPTVPRAAPAAPLSMAVEVGGGIKTVSQTIAAFEQNYPRPVATLWRSVHKSKIHGAFR